METTENTQPEASKPLNEISREPVETYQDDDYINDSSVETQGHKFDTIDEAYEYLQDKKDEAAAERSIVKQEHTDTPSHTSDDIESSDDGSVWSNDDVQTITLLQQEAMRFEQDLVAFNKAKQVDLNTLANGDKNRLQALKVQMKEAENELRQRYDALQQANQGLQTKASMKSREKAEKNLSREQAKLLKTLPDFNREELRTYLTRDAGFKEDEVKQAYDHRIVVLAEKARRWDAHVASQTAPKKVPRLRAKPSNPKRDTHIEALKTRVQKSGRIEDALELLYAQRARR